MPPIRDPSLGSSGDHGVKLWIDAQLSPALAPWIARELGVEAVLLETSDCETRKTWRFSNDPGTPTNAGVVAGAFTDGAPAP